jgi:hypothetical protein
VVQDAHARAKDRFAGGSRNDPATSEWPALLGHGEHGAVVRRPHAPAALDLLERTPTRLP